MRQFSADKNNTHDHEHEHEDEGHDDFKAKSKVTLDETQQN